MAKVDDICHDEQMTIWTGEVAGSLSMAGYLRDDLTYDDVIDIHRLIASEIRDVVKTVLEFREPKS